MIGIGTAVGHYVLRTQLGEGAMGTVFLAQHRLLDTKVAIKVIRKDVERSEEDVSRFFNEARAASRIGHENIVTVLDFGHTADGDPYYIMEHLAGETLAARLARGRLPLAEVKHIAGQIASALAAAHEKGIVHRDLKPANVLLVKRGEDASFVKLLDFGVAKLVSFDDEERGHRTHTGRLLGTPHYMSPEQISGQREVDGRADVYALGVLLFEMLAGKLPFDAPKWTEVLIQHVTQSPPRLTDQEPWLVDLVDRMLAKGREQRPSMAQVAAALRGKGEPLPPPPVRADATLDVAAPQPTLAHADTLASNPPPPRPTAPTLRTRPRWLVPVAALGGVGVILGGLAVAGVLDDEPPPTREAQLERTLAEAGGKAERARLLAEWAQKRAELEQMRTRHQLEDAGLFLPEAPPVPPVPPVARIGPPVPPAAPPPRLDGFEIERALADTRAGVAVCGRQYTDLLEVEVTIEIDSDGDVTAVYLPRKFVGTPFEMCVKRAIDADADFPPIASEKQVISEKYGIPP